MAKQEFYPADLYVQPPDGLPLEKSTAFKQFVRQFEPAQFIEADVPWLLQYIQLMFELANVNDEINDLPYPLQENVFGNEVEHPLYGVRKNITDQALKVAVMLQITPNFRYSPTPYEGAKPIPGGVNGQAALPGETASLDPKKLSDATIKDLLAARRATPK